MKEGDAPMPGQRKYAQSLTERPREPIDAARQIAGSDHTATSTISGVVDDTPVARMTRPARHENSLLAAGASSMHADAVR
jgi:hypothetical protein